MADPLNFPAVLLAEKLAPEAYAAWMQALRQRGSLAVGVGGAAPLSATASTH